LKEAYETGSGLVQKVMDPDLGCPKTYGSESVTGTQEISQMFLLPFPGKEEGAGVHTIKPAFLDKLFNLTVGSERVALKVRTFFFWKPGL
jgi:hypothetical protein